MTSSIVPPQADKTRAAKANRAVTLKDVAASAGVSAMSVSAVLNSSGRGIRQVSEAARERILHSAHELGYRRNGFAAATATGRFGSVALLTSTRLWHSYTPRSLLDGVHAALIEHDLHLMLANLPDELLTDPGFVPKILREWMTDGLLINYIQDIPQRLVDIIERHQIPAIWMNARRDFDCVRPHDFQAGQQATEHLLCLGHRRIAFADYSHTSRFEHEHYSAQDRWEGYQSAMRSAGLEPRVLRGKEQKQSALEFTRSWLAAPDRPTGVVAYNTETVPVMAVALQLGLSVPEDLSLVAFGSEPAEFVYIPVTTFLVPEKPMGALAVEMLLQKIADPSRALPCQTLAFSLSPGATSGVVKNL